MLAFDFVAALKSPVGNDFFQRGQTLTEAPQEITLRFSPGTVLNTASIASSISVVRSGGFNDAIGSAGTQTDVAVPIGYVGVKDAPNQNEVVVRFAEPLLDDAYRINVSTNLTQTNFTPPTSPNLASPVVFDFKLDLGAKIQSVVPQPVIGSRTLTIPSASLLSDGDRLTFDLDGVQTVFEFDRDGNVEPDMVRVDLADPALNSAAAIAAFIAPLIPNQGSTFSALGAGANITVSSSFASAPGMTFVPNSAVLAFGNGTASQLIAFGNVLDITDTDTLRVQVGAQIRTLEFDRTGGLVNPANTSIVLPATNSTADRTLLASRIRTALVGLGGATAALTGPNSDQVRLQTSVTPISSNVGLAAGGTITSTTSATQARDTVSVYFNANDPLNVASAQTTAFYTLVDTQSGATLNPINVVYNASRGVAILKFASDLVDNRTFRLQVGTFTTAVPDVIVAATEANSLASNADSSFDGAQNLGALGVAKQVITGSISPKSPGTGLGFAPQIGGSDEPGHRDIRYENHGAGVGTTPTDPGSIAVISYHFPANLGTVQGNQSPNNITETQKTRAREIFSLFSQYTGLRFVETANSGLIIGTGDVRAVDPLIPQIPGISAPGVSAVMNGNEDWGDSEYGGAWFGTALHEIGHAIGLGHSYDIPSVQGHGTTGEAVFPGDYDLIHLHRLFPKNGSDIDLYQFTLNEPGTIKFDAIAAKLATPSQLDTVISVYREVDGSRVLIARNDDYVGTDSQLELTLTDVAPGTKFFVGITSTGNTDFNPRVANSGYGGRSDGDYRLEIKFTSAASTANIKDAQSTDVDGDSDGKAGGLYNFWFQTAANSVTDSNSRTYFVDKAYLGGGSNGTFAAPFTTIEAALTAARDAKQPPTPLVSGNVLVRILGNGGTDGNFGTEADATPYLIGRDTSNAPLADGVTFEIPAGVTVMIDQDAVLKFKGSILDVGSSSGLVNRAGAALQVLGTPGREVHFSSLHNDTIGGNSDGSGPMLATGQWGGLVFRGDSDLPATATESVSGIRPFLNSVNGSVISYGGGQVNLGGQLQSFAPIHLDSRRFDTALLSGTRPAITNNRIEFSAGPGMSADPNSFDDRQGRIGPDIHGNILVNNSTNGLFVRVTTELGSSPNKLAVPARFKSTDIVYVIQENLALAGGAGGLLATGAVPGGAARDIGRLTVDPGVVVKLAKSRIEMERGPSQLIAEGLANKPITFTSLSDARFGAGGTFDTNGATNPNTPREGDWGGLIFNASSSGSIDNAYIAFGGATDVPFEGGFNGFNAVEVHQANVRVANSRFDSNATGQGSGVRNGRGLNAAATIFVRGAQPILVGNDFLNNFGSSISINANSMTDAQVADRGRSTGLIARRTEYDANRGPLVRANRFSYDGALNTGGRSSISGMTVRGEEITVGAIWDDTDIVHVLNNEILVRNFHTNTYQRLQSSATASLVVKLSGATAGFTAEGFGLDIDDRIGGTVQVIGQPGFPVVLTDLRDDTVGAGFDLLGLPSTDTNEDDTDNNRNNGQGAAPVPGSWRSIRFERLSNDRNVAVYNEREASVKGANFDSNAIPSLAENLGVLAPNVVNRLVNPVDPGAGIVALSDSEREAIREKGGDDNRRLGFEVHGFLQGDAPTDIDVYQFSAYTQSEVWIDIDKTSSALDTEITILRADGTPIAASSDSQLELAANGARLPLTRDAWRGGDFWGTNPKDAGLRVILPGAIPNQLDTYYVRVRSNGGITTGKYQLQIRVNQRDEVPGSTVQFADIRYAQSGVEVIGLPRQSPLVGDANEVFPNSQRSDAQELGNLLQADRNTLSVGGFLTDLGDVDWYAFTIDFDLIQVIGGSSNGTKTWSTIFDIDYADGFTRPDTTMSIFDSNGRLILTSRDSDVQDDQPGQSGSDIDDLTRGSAGKLDPYIGPVTLPTGNADTEPNGPNASIRGTGAPPNIRPAGHPQRYYVAISSDRRLPTALNGFFSTGTTNSTRVRLEPVNSLRRPVEDHIGFDGYSSQGAILAPETPSLIDTSTATALNTHITPFGLRDVTLFVSTSGNLSTYDAVTGAPETSISSSYGGLSLGDLDMRPDGKLYAYAGVNGNVGTVGRLIELNTGTGAQANTSDDGIPNRAATNPTNLQTNSDTVTALAFRRSGVGDYDHLWYIVHDTDPNSVGGSKLYRAADGGSAAGNANGAANQAHTDTSFGYFGRVLVAADNTRPIVTGLQFVQDTETTMFGVTSDGRFLTITQGGKPQGTGTELVDFDAPAVVRATFTAALGAVGATGFAGLATGPQNLQNGQYRGMLFAITNNGRLCVINPTTNTLVNVAEWGGTFSPALTNNPTGLAFSPLDFNLWHATERRGTEAGHGINATFDNTRTPSAEGRSINVTGDFRSQSEAVGGASLYFGLEQYSTNPDAEDRYFRNRPSLLAPDIDNGQFGVASNRAGVPNTAYEWQQELTQNPAIRDNYNTPGGAFGSLTTNSFSLGGYTRTDRPVLYFNYWLQTQNSNAKNSGMRDAARVFVSQDNGVTWQLLATNNGDRSAATVADGELPAFASHSADRFGKANQRVQELFETSEWRQARVDLGQYAGQNNLRLRFDFTTAGQMDPNNSLNNFANTTFGDFTSPQRGQDNAFEGFYIDDIIVGFAERGEMVTGAQNGDDAFTNVPTDPDPQSTQTTQIPSGAYQLFIRRGTEFGTQPIPSQLPDVTIARRFDTNDRLVEFPAPAGGAIVIENFETTAVPGGGFTLGALSNGRIQLADEIATEMFVPGGGFGGGEHADHPEDHIHAVEGERAMFLDAPVSGTVTTNKVVWNPNLTLPAPASAFLSFQYVTLEPSLPLQNTFTTLTAAGTGVAISGDGTNWVRVFSPGNTQGEWRQASVDLATIARNMGIALGPNFRVGFFQRGSARWEDELPPQGFFGDGSGRLGIDNIQILPSASIGSTQSIGDRNPLREQGQIIIANNIVRFSQIIGIDAVAAPRDVGTNLARPGSAVFHTDSDDNTTSTPYYRLAPGVVINNNLVTEGTIGIRFGGDTGLSPVNVVPYGRIVNNTIVSANIGIQVFGNAGPTLLNNVFSGAPTSGRSGMTMGISVDVSSAPNTVVGTSFYHGVTTPISGISDSNSIIRPGTDPMFVNSLTGNFYLAQGSRAIDSSLNSLVDRPNNVSVVQALLIPESPTIAPDFDLYGQLRQDDGSQGNISGLGQVAFKDRGAIERADFTNPTLQLVALATTDTTSGLESRLNSTTAWTGDPRLDRDPDADSIHILDKSAAQVTTFRLRLDDIGVGIDKDTVLSDAFTISRIPPSSTIADVLVSGVDYLFTFNANNNEVLLTSASTFKPGTYTIRVTTRTATQGVSPTDGRMVDLANNTLLANQLGGTIEFSVTLLENLPTLDQPLSGTGGRLTIWEDQGQVGAHQPDTPAGILVLNDVDPMSPQRLADGAFPAAPVIGDTGILVVPVSGITAGGQVYSQTNVPPDAFDYDNRESQVLRVTAVSDRTDLIEVATSVMYVSPNQIGSVTLVQVANQPVATEQIVTIAITVTDVGFNGVFNDDPALMGNTDEFDDQSVTRFVRIRVLPRNDIPVIDQPANVNYAGVIPAGRVITVTGISASGDETQPLRVTAAQTGGTAGVITSPVAVAYTSADATATLTLQPFDNSARAFTVPGTVQVTVTVEDGGLDNDLSTAPDNGLTTRVFNVTFAPLNTNPTLDLIPNVSHTGWQPNQTIPLSGINDADTAHRDELRADLSFTGTAGMFVSAPVLTFDPLTRTGSIAYKARGDVTGTATVTVRVFDTGIDLFPGVPGVDDDGVITRTFTISTTAYNDPPVARDDSFPVSPGILPEDGVITLPISQLLANDSVATTAPYTTTETLNPPAQSLTLVSVSNAVGGTVAIVGTNVVFTPAANFNGVASFSYVMRDNGLNNGGPDFKTSTANVTLTIVPVNDPPIRISGPSSTVFNFTTASPTSSLGFETVDFVAGPTSDELSQSLTYSIPTIPNPLLGSLLIQGRSQPVFAGEVLALSDLRGLQFRPNGSILGTTSFTVQAKDNGGTANGGVDILVDTFTINVAPSSPYLHVGWTGQGVVSIVGEVIDAQPKQLFSPAYSVTWVGTAGLFVAGREPTFVVDPVTSLAVARYTTRGDTSGSATVTLRVSDRGPDMTAGTGDESTATFSFNVESIAYNDSPVTGVDSFPVGSSLLLEDTALAIPISQILANDSVAVNSPYYTTELENPPNQILSLVSVSNSVGGTATIVGSNVVFTPAANFNGQASFTYLVQDNGMENGANAFKSAFGRVTLQYTPVNDVPLRRTGSAASTVNVRHDQPQVSMGLQDLAYLPGPTDEEFSQSVTTYTVLKLPNPALGRITLADGMTQLNIGAQVTLSQLRGLLFSPNRAASGVTHFSFSVADNGGNQNGGVSTLTETISINVFAIDPVTLIGWTGPQSSRFIVDAINNGPAHANDLRATLLVNGTPGMFVTGQEPGLTFEPLTQTATIAYQTRGDLSGTAVVTVRVVDTGADLIANTPDDGVSERTFTIVTTAYNDAPVAGADSFPINPALLLEDSPFSIAISQLLGNDAVATNSPFSITEPRNPPSQTLTLVSVGNPVGGSVAIVGSNVVFTPAANFNGVATFTYVVRDNGRSDGVDDFKTSTGTVRLTYTPVNDAPRRVSGPTTNTVTLRQDQAQVSLGLDSLLIVPGPTIDENRQSISYRISSLPDPLLGVVTLDEGRTTAFPGQQLTLTQLQRLRFSPSGLSAGVTSFGYSATDDGGRVNGGVDSLSETVTIVVTPFDPSQIQKARFLRAYSPTADYHFFTTNTLEFNAALNGGYRNETTNQSGFSVVSSPLPATLPIYRLYNKQTGRHYYTTNQSERDFLVSLVPPTSPNANTSGWRYEVDEGYIYPIGMPGTIEIYRLYNRNSGVHVYLESAALRDAVLAAGAGAWEQHASLGFAFFDPARSSLPTGPFFATAAENDASTALPPISVPALSSDSHSLFATRRDVPDAGLVKAVAEVMPDSQSSTPPSSTVDDELRSTVDSLYVAQNEVDLFWSTVSGALSSDLELSRVDALGVFE